MPSVKSIMLENKDVRLDDKTVVITGANTGIGKETALDLALRGASVILACRDMDKANKAVKEMLLQNNSLKQERFLCYKLDLSSLQSVRDFATEVLEKHPRIDILINNAGIMMCPKWLTKDNFEMQFGVNHLGHFLLTNLLLDRMKESPKARIVVVSSMAHKYGAINFDDLNSEKNYSSQKAYSQSKLANILFAKSLAERLKGSNVTAFSLHPGVIDTEISRHIGETMSRFIGWFYTKISPYILKSPAQGAQTTIYCTVQENIEELSGSYFSDCALKIPSPEAQNMDVANRLWEVSEDLVKLKA